MASISQPHYRRAVVDLDHEIAEARALVEVGDRHFRDDLVLRDHLRATFKQLVTANREAVARGVSR
jgi:hypothetical protein